MSEILKTIYSSLIISKNIFTKGGLNAKLFIGDETTYTHNETFFYNLQNLFIEKVFLILDNSVVFHKMYDNKKSLYTKFLQTDILVQCCFNFGEIKNDFAKHPSVFKHILLQTISF